MEGVAFRDVVQVKNPIAWSQKATRRHWACIHCISSKKDRYLPRHLLSRLMKYREEADYNPSYVFEAAEVEGRLDLPRF